MTTTAEEKGENPGTPEMTVPGKKGWGGRICRIILIAAVMLGVLVGAGVLLIPKDLKDDGRLQKAFYRSKIKEYDALFVGTSNVQDNIYPMEIWGNEGILTYNLGTNAQTSAMSYYIIKDAIERYKVGVVVLDVGAAWDELTDNLSYLHLVTDNMPLTSKARIELINEMVEPSERNAFYLPFEAYHSRWISLTRDDYVGDTKEWTYGAQIYVARSKLTEYEHHDIDYEDAVNADYFYWLDKIVDLVSGTDTKMLLLSTPFMGYYKGKGIYTTQEMFDARRNATYALESYAEDKGIGFLNLIDSGDEVGINPEEDTIDGQHMNYWGARKLSSYIGRYLRDTYGMEDKRGDSAYASVNDSYEKYSASIPAKVLRATTGIGATDGSVIYMEVLQQLLTGELEGMAGAGGSAAPADMTASGEDAASTETSGAVGENAGAGGSAAFSGMSKDDYCAVITFGESFGGYADTVIPALEALGAQHIREAEGHAYILVIDGGQVIYESDPAAVSTEDRFSFEAGKKSVHVTNLVGASGSEVSVEIGGRDYCIKGNGFRCVVYNKTAGRVEDSAAVYTHTKSHELVHRYYS